MSLSSYLNELSSLLEALRAADLDDPQPLEERLFRLTETLLPLRGATPAEDALLCILLLESLQENWYSTPAQRAHLPNLLERAAELQTSLPADAAALRYRLQTVLKHYLPAA
ncbi:MAG: UpxZ family transcription anti-terminator antagonist [Bacteroidaceae bacterium]|jgi:hypothetical protein